MEVRSGLGIGPVRFGMDQYEVRRALGVPHTSFWKGPLSETPTDAFDEILVHVHYDASGRREAVEVAPPGSATFRGVDLAGQPFGSVLVSMLTLDPGLEVDADGFTSLDLGLGVFAPGHEEEPDLPIEGVIAFRDGYYDR